MKITTVGIDLAKSVFQVHGVNERGKAVLRKQLKRTEVLKFFANLPPCLIGMEACGSAHHWARTLIELGHEARLMAPQFVKPYVKTNKNDPQMPRRSVRRWPPEHALRAGQNCRAAGGAGLAPCTCGAVKARTRRPIRSGGCRRVWYHLPQGIGHIARRFPRCGGCKNELPGALRAGERLLEQLQEFDRRSQSSSRDHAWHRRMSQSPTRQVAGIGPITASA